MKRNLLALAVIVLAVLRSALIYVEAQFARQEEMMISKRIHELSVELSNAERKMEEAQHAITRARLALAK